ncbi:MULTISPECIES: RNA polymerase sigma factor [unclassified Rhizobium]|jgi:RNA polymerase sigma-70 factor (ECF subfamily)|uniref:RNA polymerase sigma factor n=1 Tax=unclassified Rhizobium TaxID=2613769 RepID=UPI000645DC34|nr:MULTISPECIES: RNA polymerase sigma factor [unclassified Rhizobium]MBN8951298.1 RNA polymerase sigma factor [Rhizobium tropici]OJY74878.1 MAG: RNA polymerase subunit sigma-70 [Rhizobium sp. 60-20]RKD66599.1 RNA polymerase sigma-70 factor (ECF subfamily) [Rhizobium sp. WW_1]
MPTPVAAIDIRRDLVGLLPKLRRFAVTLTGDLAEADELVQSVCQRGIAKFHLWNSGGRLESWLYTMARHQWIDEARRHKLRPAAKGSALEQGEPASSHLNLVEAGEAHRLVTSLPEGLASVFLLVDVEGHSYKQAADVLGIPLSAVASRLSSARLYLASQGHSRSPRRF